MNGMERHPVHALFSALDRVAPYPKGVVEVQEQIQGTSFFPGGTGLWVGEDRKLPPLPVGGVMVLGHDFHSEAGYQWARDNEAENLRTPTWLRLLPLLDEADISVGNCFFTNVYMGLREGDATTGVFPGAACDKFVDRCRRFFLHQMDVQQPSLILALGAHVPKFLAPLSDVLAPWATLATFKARDTSGASLLRDVSFKGSSAPACVVVSLVHPCFRPSNIRCRRWRTHAGHKAEVALIREGLKLASANQRTHTRRT